VSVDFLFDLFSILSCEAVVYKKLYEQLFLLHKEFYNVVKNLKKSLLFPIPVMVRKEEMQADEILLVLSYNVTC